MGPGKVYPRTLERRLRPNVQSGFRRNNMDSNLGSWEFAHPVFICFLDLTTECLIGTNVGGTAGV